MTQFNIETGETESGTSDILEAKKEIVKRTYVTWQFIEDAVVSKFTEVKLNSGELLKLCSIEPLYEDDNVTIQSSDDSLKFESVKITNHPSLRSINPKVLLIPGRAELPGNDIASFDVPGDPNSGYLRNILVNWEAVKAVFKQAKTVKEAVMKLLRGISSAAGGVWDLAIQIDENFPSRVKIVDKNWTSANVADLVNGDGTGESKLFTFPIYSSKTIVRDVSLDASIPNEMKTYALLGPNIANGADNADTAPWNLYAYGVTDRLFNIKHGEDGNKKVKERKRMEQVLNKLEFYEEIKNRKLVKFMRSMILKGKIEGENQTGNNLLLPLSLSLTIDGISGIYFGNAFTVDYLPGRYDGTIAFQTTNVSHEVDENGWTVTLDGLMRMSWDME